MRQAPDARTRGFHVQPAHRVLVVLVGDMIGFGMVMPAVPQLILQFLGGDAAEAARYIGWFAAAWALTSVLALPILSALSDRFGRRPVLMISLFGAGLDYVAMAVGPTLAWLFVGRVVSGITAATFATSSAYLADTTPPEERAARYGLVSVATSVGYILGPALGGLLGDIDPRLPFWIAAGLSFANWLYVALTLPESLPPEQRSPFSFRRANPVAAVGIYARSSGMLTLGAVLVLYYLAQQVTQSVLVPYVTFRYAWDYKAVGLALGVLGAGAIAVQLLLLRPFVRRFGERAALATALLAGAVGFVIYGAAPETRVFLAAIAALAFAGMAVPSVQALLTQVVSPSEQGRLQGANMGLVALAGLIGPLVFTELFARAIGDAHDFLPVGAPFYLASGLMLTALGLALLEARRAPGDSR